MGSAMIVGDSAVMLGLRRRIRLLAGSDVPVLIEGESGTGKELVARSLHSEGARRAGPFVAINCGGLAETLLESELFGFHRGAFTGAYAEKPGLVEAADGGTLLLDEVGDLPISAQTRLLRVLQEGEVLRLGGLKPRRVDVRILSATHKCLEDEVREGRFREDLFYRLSVVGVRVPALRERREDIPELVAHFLGRHADGHRPVIEDDALALLRQYAWPGNVRELENEIRRAITLLGARRVIRPHLLSPRIHASTDAAAHPRQFRSPSLREQVSRFEAVVIREALERYAWNKTRAARALGLSRQSLIRKVARYRLTRNEP